MKRLSLEFFLLVLVNILALCIAHKIRTLDFVIEETIHNKLCNNRSILTVNGSFPGPALHLTYGETVRVNVYNKGNYGITLHWHGVKQPRNPWSDGPNYITQCPIAAGSNFTYEIILSDEEGTLWWHAHSDWSRATIHGPIIIHPAHGRRFPYPIIPDAEQAIIFASWFERDVMEMVERYATNGADFSRPDALLINGQPGDTYGNATCTPEMFNMTVEFNKTYLLRIINAAMNEEMYFTVANHTLILVGSDAAYLEPIYTDHILISPGKTMDVLLVADQPPSHYYMVGQSRDQQVLQTTTGLIVYSGNYTPPANASFPDLPTSDTVANFTQRLRSLNNSNYPIDVPQTVDRRIFMTVSLNTIYCTGNMSCDMKEAASLNNVTFVTPSTDVLQAYWSDITNVYKTDFPDNPPSVFNYTSPDNVGLFSDVNGTRVFVVDYNTTVEIVLQGTPLIFGLGHPIHLHGYSFYVVASGSGNYNASDVEYNLVDPPLVNTAAVPRLGWTAFRFRANNPGVWFMHCHLERHATFGMDTVMIVRNGTTEGTSIRPPHYTLGPCT